MEREGEVVESMTSVLDSDVLKQLTHTNENGRIRLLLHEEVLEPSIREYIHGRALVRKRIETVDDTLTFELRQQHPVVERIRIDREIESTPAPYWDGSTYVVPVVEEEIVVSRRLILREEVRVMVDSASEQHQMPTTIRREIIDVVEQAFAEDGTSPN